MGVEAGRGDVSPAPGTGDKGRGIEQAFKGRAGCEVALPVLAVTLLMLAFRAKIGNDGPAGGKRLWAAWNGFLALLGSGLLTLVTPLSSTPLPVRAFFACPGTPAPWYPRSLSLRSLRIGCFTQPHSLLEVLLSVVW